MSVTTQIVKKFVNDPEDVVPEALAGIAGAHPGLVRVDLDQQLIIRADAPVAGKVGLVSGGGSGHEPLHGGFVGAGMLDAACAGAVFEGSNSGMVMTGILRLRSRSMAATALASAGVAMVTERPLRPARPVRPMRWI